MFQLTYNLKDKDDFLHQITQFGAHFVSKGPEVETYYNSPKYQLRLDEGVSVNLILIKTHDNFQEIFDVDIAHPQKIKIILEETLGERIHLTKQVIRYYLKNLLLEIHRYNNLPQLLYIQGEKHSSCKDLARQLSLHDHDRISKTSADIAL